MSKEIKTRFAPSPTGALHVGGLRTALYNFLFARKMKGKFILRIEDTDKAREVEGAANEIQDILKKFGLVWDEGPIFQSQRLEKYKKYADDLVNLGWAKRDGDAIRQIKPSENRRLPSTEVLVKGGLSTTYTDLNYGKITIPNDDLDEGILLKSDGYPVYNFANVIDDHEMGVTHVIRGEEFLSSTPKHIWIYEAFGWDKPEFVHLPLILDKERKKLSKRTGDVAVGEYLSKGYLKEAIINFIAFLGWNPKSEEEIFSLDELVSEFALEKINKAGAIFDLDKLDWFNSQYIRKLSPEDLFARIREYLPKEFEKFPKEFILEIIKLEQERLKKLSEIGDRVGYFFNEPIYDPSLLVWKKTSREVTKSSLDMLRSMLRNFNLADFEKKSAEEKIKKFISENNLKVGEVLWPLRVALSGLEASPGPFEIMSAFHVLPDGKDIILKRVENAINRL